MIDEALTEVRDNLYQIPWKNAFITWLKKKYCAELPESFEIFSQLVKGRLYLENVAEIGLFTTKDNQIKNIVDRRINFGDIKFEAATAIFWRVSKIFNFNFNDMIAESFKESFFIQ